MYLDPDGLHPVLAASPVGKVAVSSPARFTSLEWTVVQLARRDRLSTLRRRGRLATLLISLVRTERSASLADPRLEALRRMAVLCWHRVVDQDARTAFVAAGFNDAQFLLMTRWIAHEGSLSALRQA